MICNAKACIFVPLYQTQWTRIEVFALARCLRVLRRHHFIFAHKVSHDVQDVLSNWNNEISLLESWSLMPLADSDLSSISHYNSLLLSVAFYRKLLNWTHVLVFQLDAWILGGNLDEWLNQNFTYIGAPWCPQLGNDPDCCVEGVGNGGLSLRNISEMIKILESPKFRFFPVRSLEDIILASNIFTAYHHHRHLLWPAVFAKRLLALLVGFLAWPFAVKNNLSYYARIGVNEDIILGLYCPKVYKWMRMPSLAEAAHFSIESNAKQVCSAFSVGVPFGCHAWERRDIDFFLDSFPLCFSFLDCAISNEDHQI